MKRILMITASAGFGGGPQHVYDLAESLRGEVMVDIACPRQDPFFIRFGRVIEGELIEIPERRFTFVSVFRLLSFARRQGISLLHSHGKGAGVYGRFLSVLSGLPLVHTPHGIHLDQYGYLMRHVYLGYERMTGWIDARTIFVSHSESDRALKLGVGRKSCSLVICNGVPSQDNEVWQRAARDRIRGERGLRENEVVVVTLSRFDYPKNMEEMLRVAAVARNLKFWLIGNGADFDKIKAAADAGQMENIWMPGFVENPLDYLAAADVYLSTSRWEGLPLAVLQAMSLGKPVVASDVTGNCDAVAHEQTGYLYPLGRRAAAAEYLNKLASDSDARIVMGDAGLRRQRDLFSVTNMARKTFELYKGVLSN